MSSKSKKRNQFPCPVCADLCRVKLTKKDKPYFQCEACGVQVFIRGKEGIRLFLELKNNEDLGHLLKAKDAVLNVKIIKNNSKINLIRAEIKKIDEKELFNSDETNIKIAELNKELLKIENESIQLLTK